MMKQLSAVITVALLLSGCSYSVQRGPSLGEADEFPTKRTWGVTIPSRQTGANILNISSYRVEITVSQDAGAWSAEPGGRALIVNTGPPRSEMLLIAAGIEGGELGVPGVFRGVAMKRLCGAELTTKATSWILKQSDFSFDQKEPAPCPPPLDVYGSDGYSGIAYPSRFYVGVYAGRRHYRPSYARRRHR